MESADNSSSPQQTESSHEEITTAKDKSKNHPRRFTDDQIKSLESIFKQETKLDPRKKLQVARDLGLQPRQVAIWFQNKRARWKSKQIEHEYNVLRSNYDTLSTRFEHLKCEKLSLQMQLQELSDLVKNLDNADSGENPNSSAEEMDQKMVIADYMEEREEVMKWGDEEEEREVISQTWRNLSSVGLLDQSSNWWES